LCIVLVLLTFSSGSLFGDLINFTNNNSPVNGVDVPLVPLPDKNPSPVSLMSGALQMSATRGGQSAYITYTPSQGLGIYGGTNDEIGNTSLWLLFFWIDTQEVLSFHPGASPAAGYILNGFTLSDLNYRYGDRDFARVTAYLDGQVQYDRSVKGNSTQTVNVQLPGVQFDRLEFTVDDCMPLTSDFSLASLDVSLVDNVTPEPGSIILLFTLLAGIALTSRRRRTS
jgi:hypothetical protein